MKERKEGTLRSGKSGRKVTSRKQAIAIGLSEARKADAKVPKKRASGTAASRKTTSRKRTAQKASSRNTSPRKRTSKKTASRKRKSTTKWRPATAARAFSRCGRCCLGTTLRACARLLRSAGNTHGDHSCTQRAFVHKA
ncbi:MAG: DUF6496 domain-containing protein, partial [Betaproteobacteria bacterium]